MSSLAATFAVDVQLQEGVADSGERVEAGAELPWESEMYGASGRVWVYQIDPEARVSFA